jgi:hypothetical protein
VRKRGSVPAVLLVAATEREPLAVAIAALGRVVPPVVAALRG